MKSLSYATVFAALSGFVVLWVASWSLDAGTQMLTFQAYWSLFFASAGFIDGITQETTRAVTAAREEGTRGTANPWRLGALLSAAVGVLAVVLSVLFMERVAPLNPDLASGLLVFGLISYVFQAVLAGVLSGTQLWNEYAVLVAVDSGIRLLLAVAAWGLGWGVPAFLGITVIGAVTWAGVLAFSPRVRAHITVALDVDRAEFARRVLSAVVATGASATLITGFPFAAKLAFPDSDPGMGAAVAAINQAVLLTRAPVLVPLQRFQSALVVRFVSQRSRIYASLAKPVAAILGVGAVGFAAAWLIGPGILRAFFPPELFVPGLPLALLTLASAVMGALIITGTAVLALELHSWYVAGWLVGSALTFALLFALPAVFEFGAAATVIGALFAGPLAGSLVHLAGLARRSRVTMNR